MCRQDSIYSNSSEEGAASRFTEDTNLSEKNFQKSFESLKKSLEVARERNDKQREKEAYLQLGRAFRVNEQYETAIEYYHKALEMILDQNDERQEKDAYLGLAESYIRTDETEMAIEYYEKALRAKEKDYEDCVIYVRLGDACGWNGEYQKAIDCYEKALQNTKECKNNHYEHEIYQRLTEAYSLCRTNNNIKLANEYNAKVSQPGNPEIHLALGNIHKFKNEIQKAIEDYKKALEIIELSGNNEDTVNIYLELADAYSLTKQTEESITYCNKALKKAEKEEQKEKIYLKFGDVYKLNNQIEMAEEYYRKALSINCGHEERELKAEITVIDDQEKDLKFKEYLELGHEYVLNNEMQMAVNSYHRALEIAIERKDTRQETNVYLGLGNVYMIMDKTMQTAEEYFEKALKLAKERGDAQQEVNACLGLGSFYANSGRSQKAVECFKKALENANKRGDIPQVTRAYLGLGVSYESSGQSQEARECFKKASELGAAGPSCELVEFTDPEKSCTTNLKEEDIKHSEQECKLEAPRIYLGLGESRDDDREKCLEITKHHQTVEHSGQEYKFPVDSLTTPKVSQDVKNTWFKHSFLDSKRKLKKEIHEDLRSFPWLCGAYGLSGPNKKINHLHIYLTVKRGMKKSKVRRDLEEKFKCDAKEYFELLQEPKEEPKIKFLVGEQNISSVGSKTPTSVTSVLPTPGGGVLACSGQTEHNYMRVREENERDLPDVQGTGTLTMFCCKNGQHYALTCFHVACASDENRLNAVINKAEDIEKIRSSLSDFQSQARRKKYYFTEARENNNNEAISYGDDGSSYLKLGDFEDVRFNKECDILSLKIPNDVQLFCGIADVTSPNWNKLNKELFERVFVRNYENPVHVEKNGFSSGLTEGYIVPYDFSYSKGKESYFENGYVVEGNGASFLEDGDSGSLVFFHDEQNLKQAFAYGVCEVDADLLPKLNESISSPSQLHEHALSKQVEAIPVSQKHNCSEQHNFTVSTPKEEALPEPNSSKVSISPEHTLQEQSTSSSESDDDRSSTWSDESDDGGILFRDDIDDGENEESEKKEAEETSKKKVFLKRSYSVCLRLDTALENLGLLDAACFNDCANSRQ